MFSCCFKLSIVRRAPSAIFKQFATHALTKPWLHITDNFEDCINSASSSVVHEIPSAESGPSQPTVPIDLELLRSDFRILSLVEAGVSDTISEDDLVCLSKLPTKNERGAYLRFLHTRELEKAKQRRQKTKRTPVTPEEHEQFLITPRPCPYECPLKRANRYLKQRYLSHFPFAPKIAVDLSFLPYLSFADRNLTLKQLQFMYAANKSSHWPCDLYFTEVEMQSEICVRLSKNFIRKYDSFYLTMTEKSVLSLHPKENIVYLSPDAERCLESVEAGKMYVIGAICDKFHVLSKATINKAEKLGIQARKLPLDDHVKWVTGSKFLPLNTVLNILLRMSVSNDWERTLMTSLSPRRTVPPSEGESIAVRRVEDRMLLSYRYLKDLLNVNHMLSVL